MIDHPLWETQVALERSALQDWKTKQQAIFNSDNFNNSIPGRAVANQLIRGFTEALEAFLEETLRTGKAGVRSAAARYLDELPPEVSAFIALQTILLFVPRSETGKGVSLTSLAMTVGDRVQDEVRARRFEQDNPEWFKAITRDFDRKGLTRTKREEYFRRVTQQTEEGWRIWTPSETLKVGLKLIELFKSSTGAVVIRRGGKSEGFSHRVEPSPEYLDVLQRLLDNVTEKALGRPLMVHPPALWAPENVRRGVHNSHHIRPYALVKRATKRHLEELSSSMEDSPAVTAVNAVQGTPWKVNTKMLEVIEWAYESNLQVGGLPAPDHRVPDEPEFDWDAIDRSSSEFLDYMRYRADIHRNNRATIGRRAQCLMTLAHARQYANFEELYYPHNMDTRGRVYANFPTLSPQGTDYSKALLQFARGKPLGRRGVYWLGVHGANCWGFDKEHPDKRARWSAERMDQIAECAADPYNSRWWTDADEPFQFLAFCFEYAGCTPRTVSHLPVAQDATCSGLQHFAAMLRDPETGFHVNLTDTQERQDVYLRAAEVAQGNLKYSGDPYAHTWLRLGLMDRAMAKGPVMIKPYGGTRDGVRGKIENELRSRIADGLPPPACPGELWGFTQAGADALWGALPVVVRAASEAMQWLTEMAALCSQYGTETDSICWTSPSGFPVEVRRMSKKKVQIETTFEGSRWRPRLEEDGPKMDRARLRAVLPPSFVSALDAAHMHLTTTAAVVEGLQDFAMIHDSFGVHAADVDQFSRIIREQFVKMYEENDVLAQFEDSVRRQINPEFQDDFPERPPLGDLDLRGVLRNPYFFS